MDLQRLREFTNEVKNTNSILKKIEIIKKYPDLKQIFIYTYDTINISYGVKSKNIKKFKDLGSFGDSFDDITLFSVLNTLNSRKFTGHNAIKLVNTLVKNNKEYEDLIYNIIDRNLKVRIDTKLINRVWPQLIPEFNVALAETYEDDMDIDFSKDFYFSSRKCDGVRLITKIQKTKNNIEMYSRQGKVFTTLSVLKEELLKTIPEIDIVLDGELCIIDKDGNEDFQSIMKEVRNKNHTIENPVFMVFDILWIDEFEKEYSDTPFSKRLEWLMSVIPKDSNFIKILPQTLIKSNDELEEMKNIALKLGWEGLIIRKAGSPYEGKRSKNLLKVKSFIDAEYEVKDVEFGNIRYINSNGNEVESEMLSNIIIEHKGNDVRVGSGFSIEQRLYYEDHPDEIIGKIITVKYFEETINQEGKFSLRFPTVKYIHGDERED